MSRVMIIFGALSSILWGLYVIYDGERSALVTHMIVLSDKDACIERSSRDAATCDRDSEKLEENLKRGFWSHEILLGIGPIAGLWIFLMILGRILSKAKLRQKQS